ncbi:MAG: PHP domain-containing protein [Armatimonadetes bacterium]|nr:PHP domain-containing protein [Armatimonadota bacterium]
MIDLHAHTSCSDGSLSPGELVAEAEALGLSAIGVCDHDTMVGVPLAWARRSNHLQVVSGIEISVEFRPGTFHLLGYHFDPRHPRFLDFVRQLQQWRMDRNALMLERLQACGVAVTEDELRELAGDGQVGRPHMARLMVVRGMVESVAEAFQRYLRKGGPCYVSKRRLQARAAIDLIHSAGGAAVVAHPVQLKLSHEALAAQVEAWQRLGLDGMEAWHSDHTPEMAAGYAALAKRLGLCVTAGSDYHGTVKPKVQLGMFPGEPPEDAAVLEPLLAAAERWR